MDINTMCEQVIAEFDFAKAAKVYQMLEWRWSRNDYHPAGIPDANSLRRAAQRLCKSFGKQPDAVSVSSGGLVLTLAEEEGYPYMTLEFVAVRAST